MCDAECCQSSIFSFPKLLRQMSYSAKWKKSSNIMAIVLDEYGGVEGIVTLNGLIEQLVGDLGEDTAEEAAAEPPCRANG